MHFRYTRKFGNEMRLSDASSAKVDTGNLLGDPKNARGLSSNALKIRGGLGRVVRHGGEPYCLNCPRFVVLTSECSS